MTSRSEDDAQAEKQIQMSLQRTVSDWPDPQSFRGSPEKAQPPAEVDVLDEAIETHGLPMQGQSSSHVNFDCRSGPCELAKSAGYTNNEQPRPVDPHQRHPFQSPERRMLKELEVSTLCPTASRSATDTGKAHQEGLNGTTGSDLGTHH